MISLKKSILLKILIMGFTNNAGQSVPDKEFQHQEHVEKINY